MITVYAKLTDTRLFKYKGGYQYHWMVDNCLSSAECDKFFEILSQRLTVENTNLFYDK